MAGSTVLAGCLRQFPGDSDTSGDTEDAPAQVPPTTRDVNARREPLGQGLNVFVVGSVSKGRRCVVS